MAGLTSTLTTIWEVNPRAPNDPTLQGPERDAGGKIVPNPRFPDMKGLAEYVHGLGLKIGLYSSPGPSTCGGCVASYQHEDQDAQSYGEWGFDYLEIRLVQLQFSRRRQPSTSHQRRARRPAPPAADRPRHTPEALRGDARRFGTRCPATSSSLFASMANDNVWEWGAQIGGNSWRTTGDITDTWASLTRIGFCQAGHEKYAGPGHFNDPDMMIVGRVGWGPRLHPTRLTPNEQYTHVSLWCLLSAPLLIGCDMTAMDDFTLSLLSNDEVLAVDQDSLGRQAARLSQTNNLEVWAKDLEDGSMAVGLFNRNTNAQEVIAKWSEPRPERTRHRAGPLAAEGHRKIQGRIPRHSAAPRRGAGEDHRRNRIQALSHGFFDGPAARSRSGPRRAIASRAPAAPSNAAATMSEK